MQLILGIQLEHILPKTLTSDDTVKLRARKYPFLSDNKTAFAEDQSIKSFMAEMSSHPVHLTTKSGKKLPSAFIPFCAYQTDLLLMGEYIDDLKFPVCNKFTPTVLDGQLCYTLDIGSVLPKTKTLLGKIGELFLLLDYNEERSIKPEGKNKTRSSRGERYIIMDDTLVEDDKEAKIFIHTLKSETGFGAGSYAMSALKQMAPTEDFLGLSPTARGCANEDQQHCLMKRYLDRKLQECDCIPWEFPKSANTIKVIFSLIC